MKKNRPSCWGDIKNIQNPEIMKERKQAYKKHGIEFPVQFDCPCRLEKSCTKRYDKMTRIIMGAINNPKSR